jgi:hypothetical protein
MFNLFSTAMNTTIIVFLAIFTLIFIITLVVFWRRDVIQSIEESPPVIDDMELQIQTQLPTLLTNEQRLPKPSPIPREKIARYEIPPCPTIPPPIPPIDVDLLSDFPRKRLDERRGRTMTRISSFSQTRLEASTSTEHLLPSLHQLFVQEEDISDVFTSTSRRNLLQTIEED